MLKWFKDYEAANPTDTKSYQIGRNIIEQIMAQPDCAGIRFYNAYNEAGKKTLVYVGVDQFNKAIVEYTVVTNDGNFDSKKAIVADRAQDNDTADSWIDKIWEML